MADSRRRRNPGAPGLMSHPTSVYTSVQTLENSLNPITFSHFSGPNGARSIDKARSAYRFAVSRSAPICLRAGDQKTSWYESAAHSHFSGLPLFTISS